MPSSRRSYSITDKLSILDEYEPSIQGRDFHALGRRHGVSASTIRGWWSKRAELTAASRDRRVATRIARRLNGGGRRSDYSELEERLHECLPTGKAKDYGLKTRTSDCKLPTSTVSFTAMVPSASRRWSYQEFYRKKYDAYVGLALRDPSLQTKAGNPKVPRYDTAAQWTLDWIDSKSAADVKKSFALCGIGAQEVFSTDKLPPPPPAQGHPQPRLRRERVTYCVPASRERRSGEGAGSRVFAGLVHPRTSLFCCLSCGLAMSPHEYASMLTTYMATLGDLVGLLDAEYLASVRDGHV
ncbi:hypothetical protein PF008_g1753 [Phytophthora fragariae]|uniref:Uncharacterized protein n=1 Tax=Phytophthora fragariae TaxID=53985 RepID=A0A6G0SJC6_9STRA|nr:hypothetical protein PF008_g1753 [Phytophthora fragariae]